MGNENRSGYMGGGDSGKASSFECDVGLGLKMQHTESYPSKKMTVMPHPSHHHHHHNPSSESSSFGGDCGGYGNNSGGGPMFPTGLYDAAGSVSGGAIFKSTGFGLDTGGVMAAAGKVLFTATQWQELERQTMIYKYMMASIPVPPELLIPFTKSPSHLPVSQSNNVGLDLRFSSGSDQEPWRCRRTDGKKWRCSRDVAPDQKYCERHAHAHKSRARSRKPVEIQSHTTTTDAAAAAAFNQQNNYTPHPPPLPAYNTNHSFQKPTISQHPNMVSAASYNQPRYTEWFMKSGTINPVTSSPRVGSKRDYIPHDKNVSPFHQNFEEEYEPPMSMSFNPYLNSNASGDTTETTRHFIDAWSRGDIEEVNEIGNYKCSLTLSMQSGGNGIDEDNENYQMGVGLMGSDRGGSGEVLKSQQTQWLNPNPAAWMGSPPGGPLGEALCLGIAGNAKGASNVPSPHGYSNSTTTSSSCEDSGRGLHFH